MKKFLLLILALSISVLLTVGCENNIKPTPPKETTTEETTFLTIEQTTTEETTKKLVFLDFTNPEAVESALASQRQEAIESINAIPQEEKVQIIMPKMSWMATPACDELNENIDPKDILVEMEQKTYHITDESFAVNITNNSDYEITLFGSMPMLERYLEFIFGGYDFGNQATAGWIRIPYHYHYGEQSPKRMTVAPGETVSLVFNNDELMYMYDEYNLKIGLGKHRLAVFMSGGPRYAEFEVIE